MFRPPLRFLPAASLLLLGLELSACATPPTLRSAPAAFWPYWGDGLAELNGYRIIQPRYGELRSGQAVLIFVTETFSASARVKADPGKHPASDEFPVLKLNAARQFQTGIYQYNLLTSAFALVDGKQLFGGTFQPGDLTKLTFSSQEWCGHVFDELLFEGDHIQSLRMSYFDGEGTERRELPRPTNGITADELPIRLRQLLGEFPPTSDPAAGQKAGPLTLPYLPSLTWARLQHKPLEWTTATLAHASTPETVQVPAGRFETTRWEVKPQTGPASTWWIEVAYPHHLVRWQGDDGEVGELTGFARKPYWKLHALGDEKELKDLGLSPLPSPMPAASALTPPAAVSPAP